MLQKQFITLSISLALIIMSCNQQTHTTSQDSANADSSTSSKESMSSVKEEAVTYSVNGKNYNGFVAFDTNQKSKRPAVLVVPEWWGLNNYPRMRAKKLATLGYIAMAVDMYGDGKIADDPTAAKEMATPYYKDPSLCKTVLDAAINKLKTYPETDTSKIAAIGYCYGGYVVLNAAKLGANLTGVVSFHGDLSGVTPNKDLIKAKILVCHGDSDVFVNKEVPEFKKSMDSAGINYEFKTYANATHAFTNPEATANGIKFNMPIKYNAAADTASWNDMKDFFKKIF